MSTRPYDLESLLPVIYQAIVQGDYIYTTHKGISIILTEPIDGFSEDKTGYIQINWSHKRMPS